MVLRWDSYVSGSLSNDQVMNPSWAHIKQVIDRLDGCSHTMATLSLSDDHYLIMCGSDQSGFLVQFTRDNNAFFSIVSGVVTDEIVNMFVGGQRGEYPKKNLICRQVAEAAVRHFAETGEMDTGLAWESDY